ncbi:uncharacterized protein LOC142420581 [Mycteria americana]|uniref:uncharacterized protein LOC142420581 n=1 Tax=Mycteria americana TaxID=33587 RepID=UPI003F582B3C
MGETRGPPHETVRGSPPRVSAPAPTHPWSPVGRGGSSGVPPRPAPPPQPRPVTPRPPPRPAPPLRAAAPRHRAAAPAPPPPPAPPQPAGKCGATRGPEAPTDHRDRDRDRDRGRDRDRDRDRGRMEAAAAASIRPRSRSRSRSRSVSRAGGRGRGPPPGTRHPPGNPPPRVPPAPFTSPFAPVGGPEPVTRGGGGGGGAGGARRSTRCHPVPVPTRSTRDTGSPIPTRSPRCHRVPHPHPISGVSPIPRGCHPVPVGRGVPPRVPRPHGATQSSQCRPVPAEHRDATHSPGQGASPRGGVPGRVGVGARGRTPEEHEWKGAREEVTRPWAGLGPTGPNWGQTGPWRRRSRLFRPAAPGRGGLGGPRVIAPPAPCSGPRSVRTAPRGETEARSGAGAHPDVPQMWDGRPRGCCSGRGQGGTPGTRVGLPRGRTVPVPTQQDDARGSGRCPWGRTMPVGHGGAHAAVGCPQGGVRGAGPGPWGRGRGTKAVTRFPGGAGAAPASAALLPAAQRPLVPGLRGGRGGSVLPVPLSPPTPKSRGGHSVCRTPPPPPRTWPERGRQRREGTGPPVSCPPRVLPPPAAGLRAPPPPPPPARPCEWAPVGPRPSCIFMTRFAWEA